MDLNDITYKINGAVFEVSRVLGAGFLEKVYENALLVELKARGLKAESQIPLKVDYKGQIVGDYVVDILLTHPKAEIKRFVFNLPEGHDAWVCGKNRRLALKSRRVGLNMERAPRGRGPDIAWGQRKVMHALHERPLNLC